MHLYADAVAFFGRRWVRRVGREMELRVARDGTDARGRNLCGCVGSGALRK